MRILLSNDDGYHAPGINVLADLLKKDHDVIVIAPDRERSACSHGITLKETIAMELIKKEENITVYSISGTPADSVKIALDKLKDDPPDILISGINKGQNLGIDSRYSGTVAAGFEGVIRGIPSFALSLFLSKEEMLFENAAIHGCKIIMKLLKSDFDFNRTLVNINVPNTVDIKGIKITRLNKNLYNDTYPSIEKIDGKDILKPQGSLVVKDIEDDVDYEAVTHGFISVTPFKLDQTEYEKIDSLNKILN